MLLNFIINGENVAIEAEYDESQHLHNMMFDNTYTVQYILDLINNGFLSLNEEISSIIRVDEEGRGTPIYGVVPNSETENVTEEIPETEPNTEPNTVLPEVLPKTITEWTDGETKLLLELYQRYLPLVGPLKKFKTKKAMWTHIATVINSEFKKELHYIQCENRYKTVLKRKKDAVDNNKKSGSSFMSVPFEDQLSKIASIDDSIEPEVTGTAKGIKSVKTVVKSNQKKIIEKINTNDTEDIEKRNKHPTTADDRGLPHPKKIKTIQETLVEIHKEREEARERRHKEKLECLKQLLSGNKPDSQ